MRIRSKHTKNLAAASQRAQLACASLLIIAVPLAMDPNLRRAFVLPKLLLLHALVSAGLASSAAAWLFAGAPSPQRRLPRTLLLAAGGWVGWLALSTLFSVDAARSWSGSYEWQNGLLTRVFLLGAAWLVFAVTRQPSAVAQLRLALVLTSIPIVAYGLLQAVGIDPIDWYFTTFVFSTFGNANHLAGYLVLMLPLTLAHGFTTSGRAARLGASLLLSGQTATLLATGSRAGIAAAAVGCGLLLVWRWRAPPEKSAPWLAGLLLVTLLATLLISAAGDALIIRLEGHEPRPAVWATALHAIIARPFTGWGLATFDLTHDEHATPGFRSFVQPAGSLWDRAHNLWLEWAVETGLPGLLLSAALLGIVLTISLKAGAHAGGATRWTILGGVAALTASLVQQQVNVSSLGTETVFWWTVGLTMGLSCTPRAETPAILMHWPIRARQLLAATLLALTLIIGGFTTIQTWRTLRAGVKAPPTATLLLQSSKNRLRKSMHTLPYINLPTTGVRFARKHASETSEV